MYGRYNAYVAANDYEMVLSLLDSIANVYASVPHYRDSYEMGVLQNNRASVFLTVGLSDTIREDNRQHYFAVAQEHLLRSVDYYVSWMSAFGEMQEHDMRSYVENEFYSDRSLRDIENLESIIKRRVNEMMLAKLETPRRLSVSYTNLGIIKRHQDKLEEAYDYYVLALDLWEDNLAARNNLNVLFGRPPEKQSVLRRLFPPEKK